jgi:hypothetical protein
VCEIPSGPRCDVRTLELLDHDFLLEHANITPQLCLGAAVLSALDTLTVAVERYRVHLDQLASLRLRKTENNSF